MQRVTISLDERLARSFDDLVRAQGYDNRSEAMRDLVRQAVGRRDLDADPTAACVATLSYVYDHHSRGLAQRLVEIQHRHHDLVIATTHVHLDHDSCLESVMLKGPTAAVRALADAVRAERGVRFDAINLISVVPNDHHHDGADHSHAGRVHLSPRRG